MEIIFNKVNEDFIRNLSNLNFTDEIREKFYEVCYALYLNMKEFYNNEEIPVSHYGTKPCTIGTVVFLINNKENNKQSRIATKYDFPTKKEGRSSALIKFMSIYWK